MADSQDDRASRYIITHVFYPLQLPGKDDHSTHNDHALAVAVGAAARLYSDHVNQSHLSQWLSISRMLENLRDTAQFRSLHELRTISQFSSMNVGDVLVLPIRIQNAVVVFRKQEAVTIFQSFELFLKAEDVIRTVGKLVCSYPGPAIEIPNHVFDNKDFLSELVNFLVHMSRDILDAAPRPSSFRDTTHPRYITELLTGILRGVGRPADITRISKRVGDEVVCDDDAQFPWRRSALWLLIRVVLQTTLSHDTYKAFVLFFMCYLVDEATCADLPSDLLHFMATKISRRLWKLSSAAPDWLSSIVLQKCTFLRSVIETRQGQAAQRPPPLWTPSQLDLYRDTRLSLSCSRDYLQSLQVADHSTPLLNVPFTPAHCRRGTLDDFLSPHEYSFEGTYHMEPHVTLYDVERAVEEGIDAWVDRVTDNNAACVKLEMLADKYSSSALQTYGNNPELRSVMFLTTIELWIALDKIAIKEIPMLAEYSPEIPTSLLENLLLCKTASLQRLRYAQEYLSRRYSECRIQLSVFSSTITADSFAVRFCKQSPSLQYLKSQIEKMPRHQVRKKAIELCQKNTRCAMHLFCKLDTISVHVWPLPANQLQAEVVVFELQCPIAFDMWRTATFHLLVDICLPASQQFDGPFIKLNSYQPLKNYFDKHPRSRISLGSDTVTDIAPSCWIPARLKQVCVRPPMVFFSFDTRSGTSVSTALGHSHAKWHCAYALPSGPYDGLQKYIDSTSHTSNEVIANQADCHEDISVHEYLAFGHLRSGPLLQWLNVLRELRGRSLTFRRPEVHMLLAQAVSEVGPLESTGWTWHEEIREPSFCCALLGELESLMQDIEANWTEAVTMDTISFILRRLLASGPDETTLKDALILLGTVRSMVFSWVQELTSRLVNTPGDEGLHDVLRDTAAICRSTFDVDPALLPQILHSTENIDILLSSAIIIHSRMPNDVSQLPPYSRLLLDRDRRLSLAIEHVISDIIRSDLDDKGINLAVRRIWSNYKPGSRWAPFVPPNSRWFRCRTEGGMYSQLVDLNILDGSFLVNGRPFGAWLPNEFVKHPLYKQIFGEQTLAVVPSDLPGMDYSSRDLMCDHQVYFSLRDDATLVIRAKRMAASTGNPVIVELIPHEILKGDLPAVLVEGHVHWWNISTSVLEIRPLHSLWETSPECWKIDCTGTDYLMRKGNDYLVDIRSQSWEMVSRLLEPLSSSRDLIISASPVNSDHLVSPLQLSVVLPRYDLSFYVDENGNLQSRNFRGMVYDENQSIGTLFGLVSRLVLRPKDRNFHSLELVPRCILIPDGDASCQIDGHHVRVEITTDNSALKRITYQTYMVNTDLGCLVGSGSLTSKLYCTYLHALTSGIFPDPLTGRSGTEEALTILQSASCWSNARFSLRDATLLGLIASTCPSRTWHPVEFMPTIKLRNRELYVLSKAIKEHYERVVPSHESPSVSLFEEFPFRHDDVLKFIERRATRCFPSGSSGQPSDTNLDVLYPARDLMKISSEEYRTCTASTHVYRRMGGSTQDIWKMVELWGEVDGPSWGTTLSLRYDRSWLAPDLPSMWLKTYNLLRNDSEEKWSQMLFSLPTMAYASPYLSNLVPLFVAFASCQRFRSEDPPQYDNYFISEGCGPSLTFLRAHIRSCAYPLHLSPESRERARPGEGPDELKERQLQMYSCRLDSDANSTAKTLLLAWPCGTLYSLNPKLYNMDSLDSGVRCHFSHSFANFQLKQHLIRVQKILDDLYLQSSPTIHTLPYSFQPSQNIQASCVPLLPTLHWLFSRPAPVIPVHDKLRRDEASVGKAGRATYHNTLRSNSRLLDQLIATVEGRVANPFQRQYVLALRASAESFGNEMSHAGHEAAKIPTVEALLEHYSRCKTNYQNALHGIRQSLGPIGRSEQAVEQSGQWPPLAVHVLFRSLASNATIIPPEGWKRCLVRFTLLALELQRARRFLVLHFNKLHEEFYQEILNEGCDGWDPEVHPDWLLVQLQGNFLIRRVQADVANEMISPRSDSNTAMQLHMGEGKSSVIVPIVVAALADGNQLVRVIVPKPLIPQTLHLLTDRLSGLTNRRIYYLPFSRSTAANDQSVIIMRRVMLECMQERGILVVQPDHILSLKLVSVEKQLSQAENCLVADQLLELQRWSYTHSRDVLDESDEILDVRSQLVFTIGNQQHIDGSPERWTTSEQVLGLVSKHASSLREQFPLGVEHEPGPPGSFPYLRITQAEAAKGLVSRIVGDVMEGLLTKMGFGQLHIHSELRDVIRSFISCEHVSPESAQLVKKCYGKTHLWVGLLLLRGLLAHGILLFAFTGRRWRVDYGLSPARTMLAVPYRAKDVPAERAEFGHSDIAIILTCLSYYYSGLTQEQLRLSFAILFNRRDASLAYDLWVRVCPNVPESLRTIHGVNAQSMEQWNKYLFPLFSRNRETVNFYLSNVVFPREAKEFPLKLSSSGWDLAEKKERVLTGFSGTNDGQYLLPLHITQRDPDHQQGTNAKVLSYLLQPENNHYMCISHNHGNRCNSRDFLQVLAAQTPEVRVLLDVGAQMLDLRNQEVAKAWLEITPGASAAIYFNEEDELMVQTRDGNPQLLRSSPFAKQLDRCVVYLDDAHTRGTDVQFPAGFRAAVTLGFKVTKDRLTQGCMRMRKLGHTHSVMFLAPLEIDRRIRSVSGKSQDPSDIVETADVLHWAIRETWENIQRWTPHWVQQAMDHESRYTAWSSFSRGQLTWKELSAKWLQPEAKSLEDLYEPRNPWNPTMLISADIRQRCVDIGVLSLSSVGLDEEQERERERELIFEFRREQQVADRLPRRALVPAKHSIHHDVVSFIKTGTISTHAIFFKTPNQAFNPAFDSLGTTSAATDESFIWSQSVLVTKDFQETIIVSDEMIDEYLRPVHWVLSAKRESSDVLVILSPFEVNCLLPDIRRSDKVHLHLYTARVTEFVKPCDDLALYNIPSVPDGWLLPTSFTDQLGAFAGQLYLKDYATYLRLCRFLCVYTRELQNEEGIVVEPDGFIKPENRNNRIAHTFSKSPLIALKTLTRLRNNGVDFTMTHMGKLLHGRLLSEEDFDG